MKIDDDGAERSIKVYLEEINRYKLLDFEQEQELSQRIMKGDVAAEKELTNANLRLVVKMAKSYANSGLHFLDLIQEGNLGLMKAVKKYDYRKCCRFSTYASWWIKQAITRAVSKKHRAIRLPHRKEESLKKINRTLEYYNSIYHKTPSMKELVDETGLAARDIITVLDFSGSPVSMDSEINLNSGTLHDILTDENYMPEKNFIHESMKRDTHTFLNLLKDREKDILMYRFALYESGEKKTLKEIGDMMDISPETVRQIEMKALKKLKSQGGEIQEYLYLN